MAVKVVLGTFFGDEGKGSTVQWLCKKAIAQEKKPIVVRFSGGPQSGHRVINEGIEHICSSFGAGVLLDVPTHLTDRVFVDPISLMKEYNVLKDKGITPKITINYHCRVITPYDVLCNMKDEEVLNNGSCSRGIYHTFKRYNSIRLNNFYHSSTNPESYLKEVKSYYNIDSESEDIQLEDMFIEACKWIASNHMVVFDNPPYFPDKDVYIFEGSQGLLLDMDCGFMPHCTPSRVGLNGIPEEFLDNAEVYLVMRTYLTRHGNGWNPIEEDLLRKNYINLAEPTNPDDGAQGRFKIGVFDFRLLERALERHHFDNYAKRFGLRIFAVVTHLDSLNHNIYYTKDGHSVSVCASSLDGMTKFLKSEITSVSDVHIDRVYGSYRVNNIKLI